MSRSTHWFLSAVLGSALCVQAQAQDPAPPPEDPAPMEEVAEEVEDMVEAADAAETDLVSMLDADGRFTVLVGALQSTNLVETLQGDGPFTVFAPTDDAFAALPEGTLDVLTPEQLQAILLYHVSEEGIDGETIEADGGLVSTLAGAMLQLAASADGLTVNDAAVVESLEATNGQLFILDSVLLPPVGEDDDSGDGSMESAPDDGP